MYNLLVIFLVNLLLKIVHADDLCPKMVTRNEWGAKNRTNIEYLTKPVEYVIIHNTRPDLDNCYNKSDCSQKIKDFQESTHAAILFQHDIGYNFLIGGDENLYEGIGWSIKGKHTNLRYNPLSIGIAFVGDYDDKLPTNQQLEIAKKLIACGVSLGEISKDYKLVPARYVTYVWSPGNLISDELAKWPHYQSRSDISG